MLKEGSRGEDVRVLQEGLACLGYHPGPIDGIFGAGTERAVEEFQKRSSLIPDGIVGSFTKSVFNEALQNRNASYSLDVPTHEEHAFEVKPPEFGWVRCPADKFESRGGFTRTTLRTDAAEAYKALYAEVQSLGGIITSAGGRRSLGSKSSPARSKKSMHYVGRAFDMALPTAMQNPDKDPYLVVRDLSGNGRKWIVWCKTDNTDIDVVTVDACYVTVHKDAKGKKYTALRSKQITCKAFNFTEIAKSHGFERISGRRSFFRGGSYTGSEWWHFQYEKGLVPKQPTFGEELLRVYNLEDAEKFIYWSNAKNCKWKVDWF